MSRKKHKPTGRAKSKQRADPALPSGPAAASDASDSTEERSNSRTWIVGFAIGTLMIVGTGIGFLFLKNVPIKQTASVDFVGSDTCAGCHRAEAGLWRSSQHRLAMQHAPESTVLGDFNNTQFD